MYVFAAVDTAQWVPIIRISAAAAIITMANVVTIEADLLIITVF